MGNDVQGNGHQQVTDSHREERMKVEKRLDFDRRYGFDHIVELKVLSRMVNHPEERTFMSIILGEEDFHKKEHRVAFRTIVSLPSDITNDLDSKVRELLGSEENDALKELSWDLSFTRVYSLPEAVELAKRLRDLSFARLLKKEEETRLEAEWASEPPDSEVEKAFLEAYMHDEGLI